MRIFKSNLNARGLRTGLLLGLAVAALGLGKAFAGDLVRPDNRIKFRHITNADRQVVADRLAAEAAAAAASGAQRVSAPRRAPAPGGTPNYFGPEGNWAYSPQPIVGPGGVILGGGIRKFVNTLPGLGSANQNEIGQYIPVATADKTTYPGSDYYQLSIVDFSEKMHSDLPPTPLRGYKDSQPAHYLGPLIIVKKNTPVRIKFTNALNPASAIKIPMDETTMGAGMGPDGVNSYSQNRADLHLHGGNNPWISDGTPHQWITPVGDPTVYKKGASFQNVPDMIGPGKTIPAPAAGDGMGTYYWPNNLSSRLMFYHDHSYGTTRLNVYGGAAAGYLVTDNSEEAMINSGVLPNLGGNYRYGIPLIIQDRTFVDSTTIAAQDPTWNWGSTPGTARTGDLWFPHVYMPNQWPEDQSGASPVGRWDYGPWFWPVFGTAAGLIHGPISTVNGDIPGTPNPSMVPEAFMDTPLVNGTPYPKLTVQRKPYRFRILNACNDRFLNLQLYYADATGKEVPMVPAISVSTYPATWPTDGRAGGVPAPEASGPPLIMIGTEGGFLKAPAVIPSQPVGYNYNRRDIVVLNVQDHALFMGPAERADVIVDFSLVPSTVTSLILYNDAPAPVPAFDTRNDYYTGDPDQTATGGSTTTVAGYGPNTRTIMQFNVTGAAAAPVNLPALQTAMAAAFTAEQDPLIVPPNVYARIQSTTLSYSTGTGAPVTTQALQPKAIQELFEMNYGRMNATLGVELPFTNSATQTTIPLGYIDPPTEYIQNNGTQLWKITHNGVDTHAMHFHLFNVQVVNRVGWDGAVRPPEPDEIGWKETVKMNPLEDIVVAFKSVAPVVPFTVPDSIRSPDVTQPPTATFQTIDPITNTAYTITNSTMNFGWEYVWHCHLLGHEENDMMRPMVLQFVPSAPILVTAVPGNASATVSFTNSFTGGSPVTGYTVTSSPGGITATGTRSPISIGGLTNGTAYTFTVTATNAVGTSPAALPSDPAVTPATAPGAPVIGTAVGGNTQATVNFTPPASNGGSPILSYRATSTPGGLFATGAASPLVVSGLTNGTGYTFKVTATNVIGTGPASAASNSVTPKALLAAPSSLVMTAVGTNYVSLSWKNNANNQGGFVVQYSSNGGASWTTVATPTTTSTFYRVNGLVTQTRYSFRVAAWINPATLSAYSNILQVTTR